MVKKNQLSDYGYKDFWGNEFIPIKNVVFNKDFITRNTTNNKGECDMYDLRGGARNGLYTTTQIQLKEHNIKEPRTVGVVDLWKTKKEDGIILKYRKKIEKLKERG